MKCDSLIETSLYKVETSLRGERVSLFDLATWKNGLAFRKINFSETGIPIIKIAELNDGVGATTAYTQQTFSEDVHLVKGDLLFSWSGTPDTSIDIFRFQLEEGWLNQHIFKVTPKEEIIGKDYFYFLMKGLKPYFVRIASNKQTIGLGHVTVADLKGMSVVLPSLETQRKIASVLSSLDDKIELNDRINANLEVQAKAIFKSWFVDFEPFGGTMPNDWRVASLLDIADYLNGLAMQNFRPEDGEDGLPVLKIKELRQGHCDDSSDRCSPSVRKEYIIHDGDVVFSWSGTLLVDLWCGGACGLNQHLFKVTSKSYDKWFYLMWTNHHLQRFAAVAADKATTMGHIKRKELSDAKVLIPSKEDYQRLGSLLKPLYDLVISNRVENRRLSSLRDALLPRLLSGELDVSKLTGGAGA